MQEYQFDFVRIENPSLVMFMGIELDEVKPFAVRAKNSCKLLFPRCTIYLGKQEKTAEKPVLLFRYQHCYGCPGVIPVSLFSITFCSPGPVPR